MNYPTVKKAILQEEIKEGQAEKRGFAKQEKT